MGGGRKTLCTLLLTAWAGAAVPHRLAGQSSQDLENAHRDGVALLAEGLDAMGGAERLESLTSVRLQAEVEQFQIGQAPSASSTAVRLGTSLYSFVRDLETGEWYVEAARSREAPEPGLRVVNAAGDAFQHDLRRNVIIDIPDGLGVEALAERLPWAPGFLLEAWRRPETVRRLPEGGQGGRTLTYADSAGRQVALTFDDAGLLRAMATVEEHGQLGTVTKASAFSDYRPVDGLTVPFAVENSLGSLVTYRASIFDVAPDLEVDRSLFSRPEGVPPAPERTGRSIADGAQVVEEIVPGVYQILNVTPLYNVLVVAQDEDVFVVEAPGDAAAHALVRDSVRSVLGGREVTGVVLTHHHFDHTSDLWRYLAEGKKVIAPASNADFVRSVAGAPRGGLPGDAAEPEMALVDGRLTVGSGPNRFELMDAGPNPHAEEILVAYFPEHRLLWVPDIYGYLPGFTPPPLLLAFADRFDELGLDVELIATAHTELSSLAEFQEMVEQVRAAAGGEEG